PEAAPYPERKYGAGGGNQELSCVRLRRVSVAAAEKGELNSRAEKTDRANRERFLDTVAIEPGSGNGDFGSRVADRSEDQEEYADGLIRWPRKKDHDEHGGGSTYTDKGEEEQAQPQENIGGAELRDGFLFQ